MKKAAILIDAGFFMQRVHATHRKHFAEHELTAQCIMDAAFIAALARKKLYGTYASKALNCEHELLSQFNNDEDKLAEYLKEKSKRTRKRIKNR
ncbi:hypothetical protein R5Q79_000874 [Escherichia coli]|nr:hypothetical protein [Escherichia coli]